MNPGVKEEWLEALRSGLYQQTTNGLSSTDGAFCCLGVLCDLHAKATGNAWAEAREMSFRGYLGSTATLPRAVMDWAGLKFELGWADIVSHNSLAGMNDDGMSFKNIADFIEENL